MMKNSDFKAKETAAYKNRTLTDSFYDAIKGLWVCIRDERNMRIHTAVGAYILIFSPFLGVNRGEYAVLMLIIALVMTAEAFNTAIENLCDFVCRKQNRFIGKTKDIAAGAVFLSAFFAVCIGIVILWRPMEIWGMLTTIFTNWIFAVVFVLSLILSLLYIIKGPAGIVKMLTGTR